MNVLYLVVLLCAHHVQADHDVTIDDQDASISYQGSGWGNPSGHQSILDYGTGHTVSSTPGDTATFTFTGVAVSFLSPLWPYDVSVNIAVDSGPPTFVNLLDPAYASHKASGGEETVASSSRWNVAGLANGIHKVVVSMPSNGKYVIVDGFIYTVADATSTSTSQVSTIPSAVPSRVPTTTSNPPVETVTTYTTPSVAAEPASTSSSSNATAKHTSSSNTVPIAAGVGAGVGVLLVCIAAFFLCRRRRRRDPSESTPWGSGTRQLAGAPPAVSRPRTLMRPSERSPVSWPVAGHPPGASDHNPWPPAPVFHSNTSPQIQTTNASRISRPSTSNLSATSGALSSSPPISQYEPFAGAYNQPGPSSTPISPFADIQHQAYEPSVTEKQALAFSLYSPPLTSPGNSHTSSGYFPTGSPPMNEGSHHPRDQPTQASVDGEFHPSQLIPRGATSPPPYTKS